jgi:hypothetical protein
MPFLCLLLPRNVDIAPMKKGGVVLRERLLRRRSIDLPRNRSCSAVVFEVYIGIHPCIRGDG